MSGVNAAVEAARIAALNWMDEAGGDEAVGPLDERLRDALAPHWPTVAVTEAGVEAAWKAAYVRPIHVTKADIRTALRASGVGVVPSKKVLAKLLYYAYVDNKPLNSWEDHWPDHPDVLAMYRMADAVRDAIGGQRDR